MKGVGPGTVLGGRYTVHRRIAQDRGTERWTADDTTLGRQVSVTVVALEDHRAAGFLDAARRAASVAHAVLVRILDVGQDHDVAYVVEEVLDDAHTLTRLVTDGGIPGDEVRRITGEVASALESARQRGMHHLDLTPDDVLRTTDGEIRLRGLEVAGVRAGEDGLDPEEAARRDAVGVVALAYAGLTGLWPLGAGGAGLGAAPRVPDGVASPSEIAAGVPRDIDAICRLTLNDDQGPTTPGDYARQVAPWSSRQVVGRPVVPTITPDEPVADRIVQPVGPAAETPASAPTAAVGPGAVAGGAAATAALPAVGAGTDLRDEGPTAEQPFTADEVRAAAEPTPSSADEVGRTAALPAIQVAGDADEAESGDDTGPNGTVAPDRREAPDWLASGGTDPFARETSATRVGSSPGAAGPAAGAPAAGAATTGAAASGAAATGSSQAGGAAGAAAGIAAAAAGAGAAAGAAAGRAASRAGAWLSARTRQEPAQSAAESWGPGTEQDPEADWVEEGPANGWDDPDWRPEWQEGTDRSRELVPGEDADESRMAGTLGVVGTRVTDLARRAVDKVSELSPDTRPDPAREFDDEAPAALVPAEPLTRDESKLALGIVVAFLVVALVIGIYGIRQIGSRTDLGLDGPAASGTNASATASPTGSADPSASGDAEGSGEPEPLAILKVEAYDPQGDGAENNNLTPKTYDGDTSTGWNSENYRTDAFGGLKKGLGLIVDLGPNEKPQEVRLDIPKAVDLEVWIGPDASLEGATKIATETNVDGNLSFPVPEEVEGQYIIVWYTGLHPDGDGKRRAWLDEVVVTG